MEDRGADYYARVRTGFTYEAGMRPEKYRLIDATPDADTVQRVVRSQDRASIRDMTPIIAAVRDELRIVEDQWGVQFHEFGFSTFSPTPETLEITQLRNLAEEKLGLYQRFRAESGLSEDAAIALISGAVIAMHGEQHVPIRPATAPSAAPGLIVHESGGDAFAKSEEPGGEEAKQ